MKEILIRLEDELYEQCKNTKLTEENEGFDFHIIKSIANGTVLPKGHGRLIDADAYRKELRKEIHIDYDGSLEPYAEGIYSAIMSLDDAPIVLEADKESKE